MHASISSVPGRLPANDRGSLPLAGTAVGQPPPDKILAQAQTQRSVIQDFCPLSESLEWELGQRYLHERGNQAFISDPVPVPSAINNNGIMSRNAAEVFFASLVEAEREGTLEPQIFVLELGIGLGLFARYFLDAFQALCAEHGKDYYERLCYVVGDRSERMLLDVCRHGVLANHPGRYLVRVLDALCPDCDLPSDVVFAQQHPARFRGVFLNYLLDCLPAAALQVDREEVRQLFVRTCLARGVRLSDYSDWSLEDLARKAASPEPNERRDLLQLFGLFLSDYDYRPTDVSSLPHGEFAAAFAREHGGHVLHNYGAIQCLERLLGMLHNQGLIFINDYGSAKVEDAHEFEHQRYTGSTFVGINFALLKAYFADSGKCQWIEPTEDNGHIYSRLLGHHIPTTISGRFAERFSKATFNWLEEPVREARVLAEHGRYEAATSAYRRALERQPNNWLLMREAALFLTFTLRNPSLGLEMARSALALNPTCSPELWNAFGDCLFALGRIPESRAAFRRAQQINPSDVAARYNMAWVLIRERDFPAALRVIAEGLALDKTGEYRERLLQKQAEALGLLAQRNQQEFQFMANRISKYPEGDKSQPRKPEAGNNPVIVKPDRKDHSQSADEPPQGMHGSDRG